MSRAVRLRGQLLAVDRQGDRDLSRAVDRDFFTGGLYHRGPKYQGHGYADTGNLHEIAAVNPEVDRLSAARRSFILPPSVKQVAHRGREYNSRDVRAGGRSRRGDLENQNEKIAGNRKWRPSGAAS